MKISVKKPLEFIQGVRVIFLKVLPSFGIQKCSKTTLFITNTERGENGKLKKL